MGGRSRSTLGLVGNGAVRDRVGACWRVGGTGSGRGLFRWTVATEGEDIRVFGVVMVVGGAEEGWTGGASLGVGVQSAVPWDGRDAE